MNIDEMTIGQAKEISNMFGNNNSEKSSKIQNRNIGKYVLVRSRNEGLNAGFLVASDETGCIISEARRIWYHKPKDKSTSWYEGVSVSGLDSSSKISCKVEEKIIVEDYSIIRCTGVAKDSIREFSSHESS